MEKHIIISDPCTAVAYPSDWSHVKPMIEGKETDAGMKVTVECEAPRVNRGSSDVTCKTGDQWEFGEKPDCLRRELDLILLPLWLWSCTI